MKIGTHKFKARSVTIDGITYPSVAEANRHQQLKLMERAKAIRALAYQPAYPLVVNGVLIGHYKPDFAYFDGGRKVAEDVKGGPLREADSLRMRIFMAAYPDIELRIVDRKGNSRPMKQRKVTERRAA